jgi:formylmethanofuran dehydrogenase subunit E
MSKKFKVKDTKALYAKKVEHALYCDFCEERDVTVIELEDENETQICTFCVEELYQIRKKLL